MLTLTKLLRVNAVRGANLNCTDAWALVLECNDMSGIGFNHKKESAVYLDEAARANLELPPLLELTNTMLQITLQARPVEKSSDDQEWQSALWANWRAEREVVPRPLAAYLTGLERHEYVEYEEGVDYGGIEPLKVMFMPTKERTQLRRYRTATEKKGVSIAYLSSTVPSGYRGPSMGHYEEPAYPMFHFALAVGPEEYVELTNYLEQPIVFSLAVSHRR